MKIGPRIFPSHENIYPPEYVDHIDEHLRPAFQALGRLPISDKEMNKYVLMRVQTGMSSAEEVKQMRSILEQEPTHVLRFGEFALAIYKTHVQASAFCYTYYQGKSGVSAVVHANWREILGFVYDVLITACDGDVELLHTVREPYASLHLLAQFCAEEQRLAIVTEEMIESPSAVKPVLTSVPKRAAKIEDVVDAVEELVLNKSASSTVRSINISSSSDFPPSLTPSNKRRTVFIQFHQLPADVSSLESLLTVDGFIPKYLVADKSILALYPQQEHVDDFIVNHPAYTTVFEKVRRAGVQDFKWVVGRINDGGETGFHVKGKRSFYDVTIDDEEVDDAKPVKYLKTSAATRIDAAGINSNILGDASASIV